MSWLPKVVACDYEGTEAVQTKAAIVTAIAEGALRGKKVMTDTQTGTAPDVRPVAKDREVAPLKQTTAEQDEELVRRVRTGDRNAFQEVVERYQRSLISTVYDIVKSREDAEDVVQESFVKAFLSLDRFRGQSTFKTYLFRIAINLAIDYRRKVQRRGGPPKELEVERLLVESSGDDPHRQASAKQELRELGDALELLSEEHRRVVLLREVEGMSYQEIAETVGVSVGTVMSRLHYARKKLQSYFDEKP